MKNSKSVKRTKEWHASPSKYGMGDYYGTGIKQKVGRVRDNSMGLNPVSEKKLKIPPRSLG